jgi:hypothetical protein
VRLVKRLKWKFFVVIPIPLVCAVFVEARVVGLSGALRDFEAGIFVISLPWFIGKRKKKGKVKTK